MNLLTPLAAVPDRRGGLMDERAAGNRGWLAVRHRRSWTVAKGLDGHRLSPDRTGAKETPGLPNPLGFTPLDVARAVLEVIDDLMQQFDPTLGCLGL